jgi:hypothetical protein
VRWIPDPFWKSDPKLGVTVTFTAGEATPHVTPHVTQQDAALVTHQVRTRLNHLETENSRDGLMGSLSLKDRMNYAQVYLNPAVWPHPAGTVPRFSSKIYQDVDRGEESVWSLMHIKSLLVDSVQLLVSSANFTAGGMERNIEFGIRTTGKPAADAKTVLTQLLRSDHFEEVI